MLAKRSFFRSPWSVPISSFVQSHSWREWRWGLHVPWQDQWTILPHHLWLTIPVFLIAPILCSILISRIFHLFLFSHSIRLMRKGTFYWNLCLLSKSDILMQCENDGIKIGLQISKFNVQAIQGHKQVLVMFPVDRSKLLPTMQAKHMHMVLWSQISLREIRRWEKNYFQNCHQTKCRWENLNKWKCGMSQLSESNVPQKYRHVEHLSQT